ncbi:MAG TPA: metalloregulator ArsR/SmtB family transcription factor [Tepidisphaeraceae bacterium]|nr:metalloregulator ArsR/SmtB family transcription factor [Tepidisphaeraceae bacterium]
MKNAIVKRSSSAALRSRKGAVHPALEPAQLAAVAELFAVLSEESRLRILQSLQNGPASVGELVDELQLKQANVSKQLGILLAAGVIARRQEGNRAIFSIAMPLVHDLCGLVCRGLRQQAVERAAALGG